MPSGGGNNHKSRQGYIHHGTRDRMMWPVPSLRPLIFSFFFLLLLRSPHTHTHPKSSSSSPQRRERERAIGRTWTPAQHPLVGSCWAPNQSTYGYNSRKHPPPSLLPISNNKKEVSVSHTTSRCCSLYSSPTVNKRKHGMTLIKSIYSLFIS